MSLGYLVPRIVRHFLPEGIVRFMLLRSMIIKPGLETVDAAGAVARYIDVLESMHLGLHGRRVLVFGYGGRFDIGVDLIESGAAHVGLCDRYASPDDRHNEALWRVHPTYITHHPGGPRPKPPRMQLIQGDIRTLPVPPSRERFDLVISNSVYEHVDDAAGITRALAKWTATDGVHIHFVDLRDHFFKYPFEMLKFSKRTWTLLLNPTSNHNRLRLWDYRDIFSSSFGQVQIDVLGRDDHAFSMAKAHIRPEFVSGNPTEDATTLIRIAARRPLA